MNNSLSILTVPAFDDNYLWIIHNGKDAVAVDPGDAQAILSALAQEQLTLSAILLTHHHADHTGGVAPLLQHRSVPVYGPANDDIAAVDHPLQGGQHFHLNNLDLEFSVIDVPGHTKGHIAYYAEKQGWLFCGDTLFAGGCGRIFEGTPEQMLHSLDQLAALPEQTLIYCAHEYTLSNLRFAVEVEPENLALRERVKMEQDKRARHLPTVPSPLALEKQTNPFLRSREDSIIRRLQACGKISEDQTASQHFAALREWKNHYR